MLSIPRWKGIVLLALLSCVCSVKGYAAEVTDDDEKWHNMGAQPSATAMAYEWFYFDGVAADGQSLSVVFLGPNPFDTDLPSITSAEGIRKHVGILFQARTPNGELVEIRDFRRDNDISFTESPFVLRIGSSTMKMTKDAVGLRSYVLHLDASDKKGQHVIGDFTMTPIQKGWKHKDGNLYPNNNNSAPQGNNNFHRWFAPVPRGIFSGSYTFDAPNKKHLAVALDKMSGYHDHNYGTFPFTAVSDGWYWGRGQVGDKTIIYYSMFGKSSPGFKDDPFIPTKPSGIIYIAKDQQILVDSDEMTIDDYGPANRIELENGMLVPKFYTISTKGLDSQTYQVSARPQKPLLLTWDFYSRQDGELWLCLPGGSECNPGYSSVAEQIDFLRYFHTLGLR